MTEPETISPFADVIDARAAKGHEAAAALSLRAAGRRRGGRVASVILQRMPPAAPPLQATPLVCAAHAGPAPVLPPVGRKLGVIISVLVAKSHLNRGQKEQPARCVCGLCTASRPTERGFLTS